jgi:hypothetical protein
MLIEKTISAENTFTEWKYFKGGSNVDISISDISDSTVTLQRKFTEYGDVLDVDTFSAATETYFYAASPAYYRIGKKTGDHGSDDVKVKMSV